MIKNQKASQQIPPLLAMCDNLPDKKETCKTCEHCERWQFNSVTIKYCAVTPSRLTKNGMRKIKTNFPACDKYELKKTSKLKKSQE